MHVYFYFKKNPVSSAYRFSMAAVFLRRDDCISSHYQEPCLMVMPFEQPGHGCLYIVSRIVLCDRFSFALSAHLISRSSLQDCTVETAFL